MEPAYRCLATVYDDMQRDIDTMAWADHIQSLEKKYSRRAGPGDGRDGRLLLLDLGCGTGSFCLEMAARGYDPIGIDGSAAMLDQARRKPRGQPGDESTPTCLFLQQDISRFELYGTVDLIVCLLDTVNHLTRPSQVQRLFHLCANYLNPGGLLIFDLATRKHLSRTLGNQIFFQDHPGYTLFWQNSYRTRSGISRSELTLFSRQNDGTYRRDDETIVEKFYSPRDIRSRLLAAGLEPVARLGDLGSDRPSEADERQFYVARKPALMGLPKGVTP
jgi:2-polyprenyl-3-methyl-5-hydroxy-6-metoxy-1,4-benzoquinol methylase